MAQKYTEARKQGNRKWDSANLDRISVALPKGEKDKIKAHALATGESVNSFVNRAIQETMERDNAAQGQGDAANEADSLSLLRGYENDPDPEKNQAFPLEDCKREWGLSESRSEKP